MSRQKILKPPIPKLSAEQQAAINAFRPMWEYGKKLGCPKEQLENFTKANIFLQPKQLEFCSKARECDHEGGPTAVMSGGGRGSSKSHAILAQIFADDCQRFSGLKVLLLRKIGKANQEQVQDYRTKLLNGLAHDYKQQAQEIIFENGSKVLMGNFKDEKDIDRYMGQEYDVIYLMESNQLTFAKKKFILTCLRTSKANWRPRLYEDTNPGGVGMAENKQMYVIPWRLGKEKETGTRYIHSTVYDNKFINKEYVKQLESLTGWQRKAWLDGDWDFAAGSFFTNFVPDRHVYPNHHVAFDEKTAVRWYASYDFGFAHNAACILFAQDKKGLTYIVDEWVDSENVIYEQAENIKAMLNAHHLSVGDLYFFVAGRDCFSRNEDGKTISDAFSENGIDFSVAEVDRANGWKRCHALFGDISANIPSKGFINQRCKNLITQIQLAQHSEKRAGDIEKFNADTEGNGGDDALDAFRFGIASDPNHAINFAKPVSLSRSPYQLIGL
jgi:PBSX family phage terminase large subunit